MALATVDQNEPAAKFYPPEELIEIITGWRQDNARLCTSRFCAKFGTQACPHSGETRKFCEDAFELKPKTVREVEQSIREDVAEWEMERAA